MTNGKYLSNTYQHLLLIFFFKKNKKNKKNK